MKSPFPTLILVLSCLFSLALAQERHNSLAIDEKISEEAGPYYFISYGDSSNAYAKASALARAMDLDLEYDNEAKLLTLKGYGVTAHMKATSNVAEGLIKRSGNFEANGEDIPSPMAIVVDGVSYVAITPVAKEAFGAETTWHSQYRLITVNTPSTPARSQAQGNGPSSSDPTAAGGTNASSGGASNAAAGNSGSDSSATSSAAELPRFRVGVHEGFTRVAVDMASASDYNIAVRDNTFVVTFGATSAPKQRHERADADISAAYYARSGGRAALVVEARHRLSPGGSGYRVGRTASNTLYVDFGPSLEGQPFDELAQGWEPDAQLAHTSANAMQQSMQQAAAAPAPTQSRPVVVLDAGHGGKFAGARNGHWREEEIVLEVVLIAKGLLEARGVDVVLTRSDDSHLSEDYRRDLSARAAFATTDRNLFVSVHANACGGCEAQGIETYVYGQPLEQRLLELAIAENGGENRELGVQITNESLQYANDTSGQILQETQFNYSQNLAQSVQDHLVGATGARDRGVKQNVYYVLQNARTPAILVELGFVSSAEEGRRLSSPDYQETLARALVQGILEFLSNGGTLARR